MHLKCYILILGVVLSMLSVPLSMEAFTVVIDPGHGGHDYGAVGKKYNEKSINLGVALKLGEMIKKNHKDVKIVYTRDGDYFKTLQQRADIANRAQGDLFISIHTNSVDKRNRNYRTINGTATYTLGLHKSADNLAVAKRENSVMMLEDDFTTTYMGFDPNSTESYIIFELSQNKHMDLSIEFASEVQQEMAITAKRKNNGVRQAGFWVLAKTGMPAVLIELEFICNPNCEQFLGSESGQKKFATSIYNAFAKYKTSYEHKAGGKVPQQNKETKAAEPEEDYEPESQEVDEQGSIEYRIQFLTSAKKLRNNHREFKGVKDIESYVDGGLHKYVTGSYASVDEAMPRLKEIKKKFPEAFIIKMKDGKRIK